MSGGLFGGAPTPPAPEPTGTAPPPVTTDLAALARQRAARQARRTNRDSLIVDPIVKPQGGTSTGLGLLQ